MARDVLTKSTNSNGRSFREQQKGQGVTAHEAPELETLTATGSSSQANSTPVTKPQVLVGTCAASTNGIRLPVPTYVGQRHTVISAGATRVRVYPNSGGSINGGSTDAMLQVVTGKSSIFVATSLAGAWRTLTGA